MKKGILVTFQGTNEPITKIPFIKLMRGWFGLGLREAKELVEAFPGWRERKDDFSFDRINEFTLNDFDHISMWISPEQYAYYMLEGATYVLNEHQHPMVVCSIDAKVRSQEFDISNCEVR